MKYVVRITKNSLKGIAKLSWKDKVTLSKLIDDLAELGPVLPQYPHYSRLTRNTYHCHLSYHWVACWRCEDGECRVEVYSVGSRESAPY